MSAAHRRSLQYQVFCQSHDAYVYFRVHVTLLPGLCVCAVRVSWQLRLELTDETSVPRKPWTENQPPCEHIYSRSSRLSSATFPSRVFPPSVGWVSALQKAWPAQGRSPSPRSPTRCPPLRSRSRSPSTLEGRRYSLLEHGHTTWANLKILDWQQLEPQNEQSGFSVRKNTRKKKKAKFSILDKIHNHLSFWDFLVTAEEQRWASLF